MVASSRTDTIGYPARALLCPTKKVDGNFDIHKADNTSRELSIYPKTTNNDLHSPSINPLLPPRNLRKALPSPLPPRPPPTHLPNLTTNPRKRANHNPIPNPPHQQRLPHARRRQRRRPNRRYNSSLWHPRRNPAS